MELGSKLKTQTGVKFQDDISRNAQSIVGSVDNSGEGSVERSQQVGMRSALSDANETAISSTIQKGKKSDLNS